MRRRNVLLIGLAVVVVLAAITGAATVTYCCGGSGETKDQAAVRRAVRDFEKATRNGDTEGVQGLVTPGYAARNLNPDELSTAAEESSPSLGPAADRQIQSISVTGDKATVLVLQHVAGGLDNDAVQVNLARIDGKWLLDSMAPRTTDARGNVIPMELKDFSFGYDDSQFKQGQPFTIRATNTGAQGHMVAIWKINEDALPMRMIEATDALPAGTEKLVNSIVFQPGEEGDIIMSKGLAPGRYMLTCFLTDNTVPDQIPHYDRGMLTEFRVK